MVVSGCWVSDGLGVCHLIVGDSYEIYGKQVHDPYETYTWPALKCFSVKVTIHNIHDPINLPHNTTSLTSFSFHKVLETILFKRLLTVNS